MTDDPLSGMLARARLIDVESSRQEACQAAADLGAALRAAGVEIMPMPPDGDRSTFALGPLDVPTARVLERLVRKAMKPVFKTASDLSTAYGAHGLDMPEPDVYDGKIHLGAISVPTAAQLAHLLGGPRQDPEEDLMDWNVGQEVADALSEAFRKATKGAFLDTQYRPYCARCHVDADIVLGAIRVRTARRLIDALRPGADA